MSTPILTPKSSALDADIPRETLPACIARLGLEVRAEFVPFSRSRNAKENAKVGDRSLNWRVTLVRDGRDILTTDYTAGIGHCPAYKARKGYRTGFTLDEAEAITFETEHGKTSRGSFGVGAAILPETAYVVHSLALDASVLDCSTFEDWASDLGYDTDSRKAEADYRASLAIALKLRNGIGDALLTELREAANDY